MKVLKPGKPLWPKQKTCTGEGNNGGGCGAVLLVEVADLFRTGRHPYDGSHEYYVSFECPECGRLTDIDDCPVPIRSLRAGIGGESAD